MADFEQANAHWDAFKLVGGCLLRISVYKKIQNVKSMPEWPILQEK